MHPTWESECGTVELYLGDFREVLPQVSDRYVQFGMLLVDPPYGNNYSTGHRKGTFRPSTRIKHDAKPEQTGELLESLAELSAPLLNQFGVVYWFGAPDRGDLYLPILRRHWEIPNVLCWDKGNHTAGDLEATYGKRYEAIVYARRTRVPLMGGRHTDMLTEFPRPPAKHLVHPNSKPVGLMEYLLSRHPAKSVLDPCMGAGPVGVAAAKRGLRYLGIEMDRVYFWRAVRRIERQLSRRRFQSQEGVGA